MWPTHNGDKAPLLVLGISATDASRQWAQGRNGAEGSALHLDLLRMRCADDVVKIGVGRRLPLPPKI